MSVLSYTRELSCDRAYKTTIVVDQGLCTSDSEKLYRALGSPAGLQLVVDRHVHQVRPDLARVIGDLKLRARNMSVFVCAGGESAKRLERLSELISWFDEKQIIRRSEPVIAVGGGALLDLVSFATALYRRGIPCVRMPTSLLGMVDASLGAKNGINFKGRKNLIGTFAPPTRVLVDPALLTTLSRRHLRSGVSEMLKAAMMASRSLFELMECSIDRLMRSRFQSDEGLAAINKAISVMIDSIWDDLWESVLRRPMDFGHSLSKTFEEKVRPRPTHGEAVSLDMALSVSTAGAIGLLRRADLDRFLDLSIRAGLPIDNDKINYDILKGAVEDTRVHRDGDISFPLPDRLGHGVFEALGVKELIQGQNYLRSRF